MRMRSTFLFAGVAIAVAAFLLWVYGCSDPKTAYEIAAEEAYKADQMRCVMNFDSSADITACRNEVKKNWGIVQVVPKNASRDAGDQ